MLLLQQITDQDNVIIADQLLFAPKFSSPLFGSIFTPTLVRFFEISFILANRLHRVFLEITSFQGSQNVPHHQHSSQSLRVFLFFSLSKPSVIDGALYCLRDRASPLMYCRFG